MYQIRCDDYILYDPRDEDLTVLKPKCTLEVNKAGEGSFTILPTHPYYGKLKKLKSVFEIKQDNSVIFRGRMTNDSRDLYNQLEVDLEGALAFSNDSMIPPFSFPGDFDDAASAENVVEYFLQWILDQHNAQVEDWQQLKLGTVTVADPNNYISRSANKYDTTWNTLKSKLYNSALGGYMYVRYEPDGNYVDYVSEFELTNTQRVVFAENLLNIQMESDAAETYSAILPQGAELLAGDGSKSIVTLASLPDGDLTDDLVKDGVYIYSKSAREQYGWICVPVEDATWQDVTTASALQTKSVEFLTGTGMLLSGTITAKAVDLHFTDDQIQSFKAFRNVIVDSPMHGISEVSYPLVKLGIDMFNPQNTTITIGATIKSLVDINDQEQSDTVERIESAEKDIEENRTETSYVKDQLVTQTTELVNTCNSIILGALESYVETGEYEQFKETVETQMSVLAGEIVMNFTTTSQQITNVDGDLQEKFARLHKYISFSGENGIVIGSGDNALTLTLDTDGIVFSKNGMQFGFWDGVDFLTGNIVVNVNERAQFGNFAFIPRSDGSLSFLKVGD